jgi:hydroxyacylglutathione hydrolase
MSTQSGGMALEDNLEDVLGKALVGLGLSPEEAGQGCGLSEAEVRAALAGEKEHMVPLADALGLHGENFRLLAAGRHQPGPAREWSNGIGWKQFTTDFSGMLVHSYVLWDEAKKEAVVFDTGADATEMLEFLRAKELRVAAVYLTHTHGDHIFDLDRLCEKTGAPAFGPAGEPLEGVRPLAAGDTVSCGQLTGRVLSTKGHSADGLTYFWEGGEIPLAVVGDALFAGSMGGPKISYAQSLAGVRTILELPDETLLCPGHGPCTTVAEEKRGNPFWGARM